jgi:predicted DCC family thiol-disulfide oxidoreductase YuxK
MSATLFRPRARRLTVLYDDECGLCTWTARQLRSLDRRRRLEFVPLQHAAQHPERPDVAAVAEAHDLRRSIHVLRGDGAVRAGGRAMLEIIDALPGGWLLRPWAALPGVEQAVDGAYRQIARHRAPIGRLLIRGGTAPTCDLGAHGGY